MGTVNPTHASCSVLPCVALASGTSRLLPFDCVVNFFTVDWSVAVSLNSDPHFVASDFHDRDLDVITDNDLLTCFSA
jgi:hypothetical protein